MPVIDLNTLIRAPRERVFDLARSIAAHLVDAVWAVDRGPGHSYLAARIGKRRHERIPCFPSNRQYQGNLSCYMNSYA